MPFLPQFDYDIFVSYSLANDECTLDGKPWVRQFVSKLTSELKNRLPGGGKDVSIYYAGKGDLQPGQQLDSCLEEAKKTALFLIVGSPRYLDIWPTSELRSFVSTVGRSDRVFIAELLPLPEGGYPDIIGNPLRKKFHAETDGGATQYYSNSSGEFAQHLAELADGMAKRLASLQPASSQAPGSKPANPAFQTVLIAHPTPDLATRAMRLRKHLQQFQVPVLPDEKGFLEEGAAFKAKFLEYLEQAPIVVQLLGPFPDRRTADIPEGYDGFQNAAAKAKRGNGFFQWRDRSTDISGVEDPQHLKLLEGASIEAFEEFKATIQRLATAPPPPPGPLKGGRSFIFVDAEQIDSETARKVFDECRARKIPVLMPDYRNDKARDWRENYADADRIAVIHEKSDPRWLRSQLRLFMKTAARGRRAQDCFIYLGPPPPKTRDDVSLDHPQFQYIDATNGSVENLFEKLF